MSYDITTLIFFSVALLNVTVNLVCGVLLLWKRKEVPDRSRTIFAIPCLLAVAVFCNKMLMLTLHPDANPIMEVLSPFMSTVFNNGDGSTTAIDDLRLNPDDPEDSENSVLFDLQGRRVTTPPSPGIYIRNGKKIIVK